MDIIGAEYGYVFVRDRLASPMGYTHGMNAPLDFSQRYLTDMIEVGAWGDAVLDGRIWSGPHPLLRDLFQVNLLSEAHMAVAFDGLGRLNDWIPAQPGRGRLDSLGEGRWLWTLTDAEMVHVRPMLNAAGLLLSCNPRVYRDLPDGGREA